MKHSKDFLIQRFLPLNYFNLLTLQKEASIQFLKSTDVNIMEFVLNESQAHLNCFTVLSLESLNFISHLDSEIFSMSFVGISYASFLVHYTGVLYLCGKPFIFYAAHLHKKIFVNKLLSAMNAATPLLNSQDHRQLGNSTISKGK